MADARILVVEDERIVALDIRDTLIGLGMQVVGVAANTAEALALAARERPDLALVDVSLGGGEDGVALAGRLQREADLAVVFLTAFADDQTVHRALESEPYGYVIKPYDERALHATVETALARHRLERALRAEQQRYRALFDRTNDAVLIFDLDGVYREANQRAAEMLRCPVEAIVGRHATEFIAPAEHNNARDRIQAMLAGEELPVFERTMRRADGDLFLVEINVALVRDERGQPSHMHGVVREISERKQAETKLAHSEALYRAVVQDQTDLVCRFRPDGTLTFVNEAYAGYFGRTAEELVGRSFMTLLRPAEQEAVRAMLAELNRGQPVYSHTHTVPNAAGEIRWVQWTNRVIELDGERASEIQAVGRDISEQVAAEDALRESKRELEATLAELKEAQDQMMQQERLAAVGQLAAGIAHDFNNILASIILYAELMLNGRQLPAADQARAQAIRQQGQRAAELVQQILDFSRRAVLRRQELDLVHFATGLRDLVRRTLPANIELHLDSEVSALPIMADPERLQQAVLNLVLNARDAMPAGGELWITTDVQVDEDGALWACLTVRDSGAGMLSEVLPHIFEPFFTTKEVGQGAGLGLSQVYGILKQHGGRVEVSSEVGRGSAFVLWLPARVATPPPAAARGNEAMPAGAGQRVLVVEDHRPVREALTASLESLEYRAEGAADGYEALERLASAPAGDPFALVLTNVTLLRMDGEALCQVVKQRYPALRVLLISGYPLSVATCSAMGADGSVQKPVDLSRLAQAVAEILAGVADD